MNKKAEFGWEQISKILLVLVALLILIGISIYLKDEIMQLVDKIGEIFRFGA